MFGPMMGAMGGAMGGAMRAPGKAMGLGMGQGAQGKGRAYGRMKDSFMQDEIMSQLQGKPSPFANMAGGMAASMGRSRLPMDFPSPGGFRMPQENGGVVGPMPWQGRGPMQGGMQLPPGVYTMAKSMGGMFR